MTNFRRWLLLLIGLAALTAQPARADSWAPATAQTILSPGKTARVTIMPRQIEGALEFFRDKVKQVEPAGAPPGDPTTSASARVEVLRGKDWVELWRGPVINDVSPVTALVSDNGRRLLTLDNWHTMGWGDDAIAVYDETGRKLSQSSLEAVFGKEFVDALPHSVSSIHWRGSPVWRDGRFVIPVVMPTLDRSGTAKPATFDLIIDASNGRIEPPDAAILDRGRAVGREAAAAEAKYRAERQAWRRAPLLPPAGAYDEQAWGEYLDEAFLRLDDRWRSATVWDVVLRPRAAKDYAASATWVQEYVADTGWSDQIYGSPEGANLAAVLTRELFALKPGSRRDLRLYVVNDGTGWDALTAAARRVGATVIRIDPAVPIPQRPERLEKSDYELLDAFKDLDLDEK